MNTQLKNIAGALALSLFSLSFAFSQTPEEGFSYLYSEQPEKAKEVFTKLAESSPSAENYYNLGYYFVRANQLDEAQKTFEKGLAVDDKSYLNQVGLATVALGKGDVAKAKEMIEYAEKKTRGKDANVLFRAGEAYTLFDKYNDPAEAIRLLDEAVKKDNKLAAAYIVKGDILSKRNEGGPAVTAYEYALMAKPNDPVANNRIGQIYLRGKSYNQALDYYKKAIEANPDFSPAYKDLAELYYLAQQYKRAAENFDLYIQKSGNNDPETVLRAAQFAFTADEYARSLELLESIKGKINNPITKRMYGWAYYKTNNMEEAIKNLEEFIEIYPKEKDENGNAKQLVPDDFKYLGRAYNKMATDKEYTPKGMEYLMKGAEMDTSTAEAATTFKEIANVYYKDKDYLKAAKAYEKGIGLDTAKATTNDYFQQGLAYFQGAQSIPVPDSANATIDPAIMAKMPAEYATLDSAGLVEAKKKNYLRADSTFAKGTVKLPDWPYNYYWRGSSLYNAYDRQENIDKGISAPYYEKFAELAEKDPSGNYKAYLKQVYSYLAYYYQTSVKDETKAKSYWEKLLVVDPENKTAKDALGMSEPAAVTPKNGK
jgi:tetratricopeptide (TPR) repeat protein